MGPRFNVFRTFSALALGSVWFIGCGTGQVVPVTGPIDPSLLPSETGNTPPQIFVIEPSTSITLDDRDTFTIVWRDTDPDTNALVTGKLDPDFTTNNGNEITIFSNISEDNDDPDGLDRFVLNTAGIPAGTYFVVLEIFDELNDRVTARSAASLRIVPAGLSPGNAPPKIVVTTPTLNIGVGQGNQLVIEWTDSDPDSNATLYIVADLNSDPNDDNVLNPTDPGIVLLGLRTEDADPPLAAGGDGQGPTGETPLPLQDFDGDMDIDEIDEAAFCAMPNRICVTVDIDRLPVRPTGDPYFIRITADDQVNPQVHGYAAGTIRVLVAPTGTVDLAQVGKTVTGATFQGFNTGGQAGSDFLNAGDYDGDGADDPMIIARFGEPFNRGNVGQAYLMFGIPGVRFSGTTNLNAVGVAFRGVQFASGYGARSQVHPRSTDGLTSAASFQDTDGDGLREFLFGFPRITGLYDNADFDPGDTSDAVTYGDLLPDDFCTDGGNDDLGSAAFTFSGGFQPFESGYMIFSLSSGIMDPIIDGTTTGLVVDLALVGQTDPGDGLPIANDEGTGFPGSSAPPGARFRGHGYDFFGERDDDGGFFAFNPDPITGFYLVHNNNYAQDVAVMPDMSSSGIVPIRDGVEEILISVPQGGSGPFGEELGLNEDQANIANRPGKIVLQLGFNLTLPGVTNPNPVLSFPWIRGGTVTVGDTTFCIRSNFGLVPTITEIVGAENGDFFGYASSAGDFNRDGSPDILCGAPGADRNGKTDSGILYVIFGSLSIGNIQLGQDNAPRVEIHGDDRDQLGTIQSVIGDFNGGTNDDIIFGLPKHDSEGFEDSGFVGIVLGDRLITGENVFSLAQLATSTLPGVIILGDDPGDNFGNSAASAGDYNGDGLGDVVITAPGETRFVDGQLRRGVTYIVFGNSNAVNRVFFSSQIGTEILPGAVFVSPYEVGTLDESAPTNAKGIGDIDSDGFDDVMIGNPLADFVDPAAPGQRRNNAGEVYFIYGNGLN